jgi:hypothetical protein
LLGVRPAASASVRPVGGDPSLPSLSEASSGLLELGAAWKSWVAVLRYSRKHKGLKLMRCSVKRGFDVRGPPM